MLQEEDEKHVNYLIIYFMADNVFYGQKSTLSTPDATLHINIEDQIVKYPDWQFPILKRWNSTVFKAQVKSHKYEWTERDLRPSQAKVASATVASDATSFYVDTAGVFNVDDVLQKPDGETVIVTAVSGGTLLTVAHWAGTAEEMVLGETVKRIGVAAAQGTKAGDMVLQGTEDLYNFTQIFKDSVHLSGTQREALIHGDQTQAQIITEKQQELAEMLQNALILGPQQKDTATKRYSMGGVKHFIDTYASANAIDFGGSSTWNTDKSVINKFEDAVEKIAEKNGNPPTIYMGYGAMRKFRLIDDTLRRTERTDKKRGIGVVTSYLSQLGELDVVMLNDRAKVLSNMILFVDESRVGYKAMRNRGWFTKELGVDGDYYKWQVLGEYTMKIETPKIASYLYNI